MRRSHSAITLFIACGAALLVENANAMGRIWKGLRIPEYAGRLTPENIKGFAEKATKQNIRPRCVKLDVRLEMNEPGLVVERSPRNVTIMKEGVTDWRLVIEGEYADKQFIHFDRYYLRWQWGSPDGSRNYVLAIDKICDFDQTPPLSPRAM
jgi:hypothetical protein